MIYLLLAVLVIVVIIETIIIIKQHRRLKLLYGKTLLPLYRRIDYNKIARDLMEVQTLTPLNTPIYYNKDKK